MKKLFSMLLAMALLLTALPLAMAAGLTDEEMAAIETQSQKKKANVIITNDGECDDMDSMLRYLNYANEFNTKAIIICSSSYHWTGGTIIDPATHEPAKYDPDVHGPTEPYETEQRGQTVTVTPDVTPFEYTSPTTGETYLALHYKQSRWTGLNWYNAFLNGYEESYENLSSYDDSYPTPEYLRSITYVGNIKYKGEMLEETEGSLALEKLLLNNEDGEPLYVLLWGGCNTLARALKSIEEDYKDTDQWEAIYNKICSEVVFYMILNQDNTYADYISVNWADTKFVHNSGQFWSFAYAKSRTPNEYYDQVFGTEWSDTIVNIGSPLLSMYLLNGTGWELRHIGVKADFNENNIFYTWKNAEDTQAFFDPTVNTLNAYADDEAIIETWGENENRGNATPVHEDCPDGVCWNEDGTAKSNYTVGEDGYFISEGDSPSFFYLLSNGLRSNEDPTYGGWGGRFVKESDTYWTDSGCEDYNPYGVKSGWGSSEAGDPGMDANYTQTRWFPDIQADFTARAQWTVTKDGNLAPKSAVMNGLDLTASAGETLELKGVAYDPNGDNLSYAWWQYFEADTYDGEADGSLTMSGTEDATLTVTIPADAEAGETIHLIFEAKDDNATPMKTYKRVIITVQ